MILSHFFIYSVMSCIQPHVIYVQAPGTNPFHATDLFLYPRKTSESTRFIIFSGGIERVRGMKWINVYLQQIQIQSILIYIQSPAMHI